MTVRVLSPCARAACIMALPNAKISAKTWDDVEKLMYADEPVNFLLEGEPVNFSQPCFRN